MRLAFADLFFSWPPHGGADVDLYHTVRGLQEAGHEVHVFASSCNGCWDRGRFYARSLPFPATQLNFTRREFNRQTMPARFRVEVDAWTPDAVVVGFGYFLKPYLIEALAHYPLAARFYAYEVSCARDKCLFRDGASCPHNYLRTPEMCRQCTLQALAPQIKQGQHDSYVQEYLAARAYMPAYHEVLARSLGRLRAAIVYNGLMKRQLEGFVEDVFVVPGGVDAAKLPFSPPIAKGPGERKMILMPGRAEDPAKGVSILHAAGALLAARRSDFEILATLSDYALNRSWFRAIGWQDQASMTALYARCDICVVPSLWEEPFGMVAAEAMAAGRPVCASRVGGLQEIVLDGKTGFLFSANSPEELAAKIEWLLDDASLRASMGEAGRARAKSEYDWPRIIDRYYPPILKRMKGEG